jgi:site-specific recombinase XerD
MKNDKTMQTKLPKVALDFLKAHPSRKREPVLRAFHRFMNRWQLSFKDLKKSHVLSFIAKPNNKDLSAYGRAHYRKYLLKYLFWLHDKNLLRFDPMCFSKKIPPLPDIAARHIRALAPTHKKGTLCGHRCALRNFHLWLGRNHIALSALKREHIIAWLEEISGLNLKPKTVNHRIILVRIYLRSLYEKGIVHTHPDVLIRSSDRIKEPRYLPRPLPPAADKILQERLANSDNIYAQALLLMRKTGLRIGELSSLEFNCVRYDHLGNHFLNVPLGKLNSERLVPLDDTAAALIDQLRDSHPDTSSRSFLIQSDLGKKVEYRRWSQTLKEACIGLETNGKMVTHRLRHTYATALLSAGVSLPSLMKLLGHSDYHMTLRYADITQETVGREYFEALALIEHRYADNINASIPREQETDPIKILSDVERLIQKRCDGDKSAYPFARAIIKRIRKIQSDIQQLFPVRS